MLELLFYTKQKKISDIYFRFNRFDDNYHGTMYTRRASGLVVVVVCNLAVNLTATTSSSAILSSVS